MTYERSQLEAAIRCGLAHALTDREMAAQLHLGPSTISHWRHRFGLAPADKFERRFRTRYGPDAVERFRALADAGTTFRELGAAFGVSHEYARQVYCKLYQRSRRGRTAEARA
jgi:hypothetical protein